MSSRFSKENCKDDKEWADRVKLDPLWNVRLNSEHEKNKNNLETEMKLSKLILGVTLGCFTAWFIYNVFSVLAYMVYCTFIFKVAV